MKYRHIVKLLLTLLIVIAGISTRPAGATVSAALTVTVDSTGDGGDINSGDGTCKDSAGDCTLRAAIQEINEYHLTNPGTHSIEFNIPGAGPHTIAPTSSVLMSISAPIHILGTTQPGTTCPTAAGDPADLRIIIEGGNLSSTGGIIHFSNDADGSTVKGLVLNNHTGAGIRLSNTDNVVIQCNYIGLDVDGITPRPLNTGIFGAGSDDVVIGGVTHADRNIISGNTFGGINFLSGFGAQILNNYIGTDATGLIGVGNGFGVAFQDTDVTILGNTNALGGNVIAGNGGSGVSLTSPTNSVFGSFIQNNLIGVARDGLTPLGNGGNGIYILGNVSDIQIGGTGANEANIIANNAGNGLHIQRSAPDDPQTITIRGNQIYNNGSLGIDLNPSSGTDGVTANDGVPDSDTGPNSLLNYPDLTNAVTDGSIITFTFSYAGAINSLHDMDIYLNDSCDPSGHGEGQTLILESGFLTGGSGTTGGTTTVAAAGAGGKYLTAAATFGDETSEFSACAAITDPNIFVVNDNSDLGDASTLDGRCDTDSNAGNGHNCTLRAAIQQANALGSVNPNPINFDIPGGPHVISLSGPLPDITHPVLIDAATQPGASCPDGNTAANIQVTLNGNGGATAGLTLASGSAGTLIRGLAIVNFNGNGIQMDSDNNTVQCNLIGLDNDGDTINANDNTGIVITGDNNLIGGVFDSFRNVISGNGGNGISLAATAGNNDILGNIIGLDATAQLDRGNSFQGIRVFGSLANDIGGTNPDLGNYIGGNTFTGIALEAGSQSNDVLNNKIGVDINGNPTVGNGTQGILLTDADFNDVGFSFSGDDGNEIAGNGTDGILLQSDSSNNQVWYNNIHDNSSHGMRLFNGDDNVVKRNTIQDNAGAGIQVSDGAGSATGNQISKNSIYNNSSLGIDLEADGNVEVNDDQDPDSGANNLQNYPVLTLAADDLTVLGTLNSEPTTTYTIEFYSTPACDSSGHGEGQTFLDDISVTTNASGDFEFTAQLNADVSIGDNITALATNTLTGDTSEFSACIQVEDAIIINSTADLSDETAGDGTCDYAASIAGANCTLRAAIEEVNTQMAISKTVYFAIEGAGPHTITLATALPPVSETIVLDALSYETGADCETGLKVFIDGTSVGANQHGLFLTGNSSSSTVQGLAIGNFSLAGISVATSNNNIWCNYLGLEADGVTIAPNQYGVIVAGSQNTIGASGKPNFTSGNSDYGIYVNSVSGTVSDVMIQYNTAGLDISRTLDKGNGLDGLYMEDVANSDIDLNIVSGNNRHGINLIDSTNITVNGNYAGVNGAAQSAIGNSSDGLRLENVQSSLITNGVFSGNTGDGVEIDSSSNITLTQNSIGLDIDYEDELANSQGIYIRNGSSAITIGGDPGIEFNFIGGNIFSGIRADNSSFIDIFGNAIGVDGNDQNAGNGTMGVFLSNSSDVQIGDTGKGNVISFNGADGISILGAAALRNHIFNNKIVDNGDLGIDLNGDGVDVIDVGDVDGNANGTQNFPDLFNAWQSTGGTSIFGNLKLIVGQPYTLDFYSSTNCDASGNGEGSSYVGSLNLAAVTSNITTFFGEIPAVPLGEFMTAIATDNAGNSSEFSACQEVVICTPPPVIDPAIAVVSGSIELSWSTDPANWYRVFRAVNDPYFTSMQQYGSSSTTSWTDSDTNEVGDVAENHYYYVYSETGCFSEASKTVGEFDFAIVPGQ